MQALSQLSYTPYESNIIAYCIYFYYRTFRRWHCETWRPHGDSNPGTHRERVMS
jgi:hypothetical protein